MNKLNNQKETNITRIPVEQETLDDIAVKAMEEENVKNTDEEYVICPVCKSNALTTSKAVHIENLPEDISDALADTFNIEELEDTVDYTIQELFCNTCERYVYTLYTPILAVASVTKTKKFKEIVKNVV